MGTRPFGCDLGFSEANASDESDEKIRQIIKQISEQLACLGVSHVRGLSPERLGLRKVRRIYQKIATSVGKPRLQYGQYLAKVEDQGYRICEAGGTNINTSESLWFHSDLCDVTALCCIRQAKQGGETHLVSSGAIHNKMRHHTPELLSVLYKPFYRRLRHIETNNRDANTYHLQPVFRHHEGHFSCDISRPVLDRASEIRGVPPLTATQIKALDTFEAWASDQTLCYTLKLQPGEMLFLNNHHVLHARSAFKDDHQSAKKRLLLRYRLTNPIFSRIPSEVPSHEPH